MHRPSDAEMNLGKVRNYGNFLPLAYIGSFSRIYVVLEQAATFIPLLKKGTPLPGEAGGIASTFPYPSFAAMRKLSLVMLAATATSGETFISSAIVRTRSCIASLLLFVVNK